MMHWTSFRSGLTQIGGFRWVGPTLLGLITLLPTSVLAQGLSGRVLDAETDIPISAAVVVIHDVAGNVVGQAVSNARGGFSIFVGQQGNFRVNVEMIGYEAGGMNKISFSGTEILNVDLVVTPVPIILDDFTVTGESEALTYMQKTGFYARREQGFGNYIETDEHKREHMLLATDLVRRVPGITTRDGMVFTARGAMTGAYAQTVGEAGQVRGGIAIAQTNGGFNSCPLKIVVDGMDMGLDLDLITSRVEVLAMEVYKGFASIPARWQHTVSRGGRDRNGYATPTCGLVLVWTRHS